MAKENAKAINAASNQRENICGVAESLESKQYQWQWCIGENNVAKMAWRRQYMA
jgi:hypothetical protein